MKTQLKVLLIVLTCSTQLSFAAGEKSMIQFEIEEKERNIVTGGIGIGLGVFNPAEVNQYIEDQTSHLLIIGGLSGMFANFYARASVNVRPHRLIQISGFVELGWAPKYFLVDVDNDFYYSFTRISPGVSPKLHIPMGTGRHSFFIAPALTFNFLKFKDGQLTKPEYKANNLGGKIQIGFNLDLRKIQLVPFIGYDYAKATDPGPGGFELNYSGAQLGIELHF